MPSGRAGPQGPPADVLARFCAARVARLATAAEGRPRLVPVTFAWHRGRVVWAVDEVKPKRSGDLRRTRDLEVNPWVALLVDHYDDDWSKLWWVELRGMASVLEGEAAEDALDALAERYPAYRSARPRGPVVAIAPDGWTWWSAG